MNNKIKDFLDNIEVISENKDTKYKYEALLEQYNKKFVMDILVNYETSQYDNMWENLKDTRKLRNYATKEAGKLGQEYATGYQMGYFVAAWNIFNRILSIQEEKSRLHKKMIDAIKGKQKAYIILNYLAEHHNARNADIARATKISKGYISDVINELNDSGIVEKWGSGKAVFYELTYQGREWAKSNYLINNKSVTPEKKIFIIDYNNKKYCDEKMNRTFNFIGEEKKYLVSEKNELEFLGRMVENYEQKEMPRVYKKNFGERSRLDFKVGGW